ncbi:MAG: XdhC family protein [Candidatus Thorarchaeota archaeon]
MQREFIKIIDNQIQKGGLFALITVIEVSGSTPQRVGAKMIVDSLGNHLWGTIGGGTIEKLALKEAQAQIRKKTPLLKEYELTEEGEKATGMLCGGKMSLFYDILGIGTKVYIFGAGHISQRIVPLLTSLGFWTIVIDDRKEYLQESFKNSNVAETLVGNFPQIIDTIEFEKDSYIVILTYSHDLDEKILRYFLTTRKEEIKNWKYLGMIGSKRKVKEIFNRLVSQGIDPKQLEKVHAPIGIPIGSQTPEEIAVSIAAEIIKVRNKKE